MSVCFEGVRNDLRILVSLLCDSQFQLTIIVLLLSSYIYCSSEHIYTQMEGERERGKDKRMGKTFWWRIYCQKKREDRNSFVSPRRCLLCNSNLFGDIFLVFFLTGELGRGDCRPMAGQEGNSYCVLNAGQRGPPFGQDLDGSQRMVRRLAGLIFFCFWLSPCPSVSITICHVAVLRQRNHRATPDIVNGPTGKI